MSDLRRRSKMIWVQSQKGQEGPFWSAVRDAKIIIVFAISTGHVCWTDVQQGSSQSDGTTAARCWGGSPHLLMGVSSCNAFMESGKRL